MRLALALIGLGLGGVLFLQWRGWPPEPPAAPPTDTAAELPAAGEPRQSAGNLLPPPPREEYASVSERPLFLPDRRPPPDEPEDEGPVLPEELKELDGVDFSAVVITPDAVKAWITPYSQERDWLRIGDEIDGWTLTHIGPESLVLERQGETNELLLRDYANAPPPIPPTPPPAARHRGAPGEASPGPRDGAQPQATRRPYRPASAGPAAGGGDERARARAPQLPSRNNARRPVRPPRDVP